MLIVDGQLKTDAYAGGILMNVFNIKHLHLRMFFAVCLYRIDPIKSDGR